jgi:hypothetical protein
MQKQRLMLRTVVAQLRYANLQCLQKLCEIIGLFFDLTWADVFNIQRVCGVQIPRANYHRPLELGPPAFEKRKPPQEPVCKIASPLGACQNYRPKIRGEMAIAQTALCRDHEFYLGRGRGLLAC